MCATTILLALLTLSTEDVASPGQLTVEDVQVALIANVHAPAKEAGILAELSVTEGDLVDANAELGRLASDLVAMQEKLAIIEHDISKLQSENDVDRRYATKSYEVAQSELKRSLESVEISPRSISQTEIDRLRLVVEQFSLSIEQSERDLQIAELTKTLKGKAVDIAAKHINRHRIIAPTSGMVVQVYRRPGEWLNAGDPVARIIRLDRLRIEAFIDGRKHGNELKRCPVRLTTHLPPDNRLAHFDGEIVFVSPELQPVNGQMRVWAEVENRDLRLRAGDRGTLTIDLTKSTTPTKHAKK